MAGEKSQENLKTRGWLAASVFGLFAIIVFGLLWFFFLAPSNPAGLGWYLFSFASGLSMIVLPCTLPLAFVVVPLSMGKGMVRGLGIALSFGLGVSVMLSIYGVIAAVIGNVAIESFGAPLESIKNWVYFIAGIFVLIFALGGVGLVKYKMPSFTGAAPAFIQKRQEFVKAFFLGLFLGNIGVGCPHPATPLLLIEIASSGNVLYGWLLFLVHAIGRVLPLLFLAFLGILGVNGLSWIVARKDKVERVTGWAMVFVAGFILTLGLFTHDWWVNSGIHTQFEKLTFEESYLGTVAENLDSDVVHRHGPEEGPGLFGLPLWLGNWFMVFLWVFPIWWWWFRKRRQLMHSPAMVMADIERQMDELEKRRREVEEALGLEEKTTNTDLALLKQEWDKLEETRRLAEQSVKYGEEGILGEPLAQKYEIKILNNQKNIFILLTILLAFIFIYYLPHNFLKHEALEGDHGDHAVGATALEGVTFNEEPYGPPASPTEMVYLEDGDTYDLVATIVQKQVGNRTIKMLAYNGSIPGPIIKVDQGSEITINFTNDTNIETTIHSHGIRIDNNFDGVPFSTQDPIEIGESFQYKVKFSDAGFYWYHPHIREDYAQEHGMYGNYIVEPSDENYWGDVNREVPIIVDDIRLNKELIEDFYKEFTNYALLGRFGNEYLVNGEIDQVFNVKAGEVLRIPLTNVANVRTFKLSIPGARIKLVGADIGKFEHETFADDFLISPAERVVVEVYFEKTGQYKLTHTMPSGSEAIATFNVSRDEVSKSYVQSFLTLRDNVDVAKEFEGFEEYLNRESDKKMRLTVEIGEIEIDHSDHAGHEATVIAAVDDHDHGVTTTNHEEHAHSTGATGEDAIQWDDTSGDTLSTSNDIVWKIVDEDTGLENMDIDWNFKVGDLVKISMENDMDAEHVMQHPIHFHGQRFVVLAVNGVPNDNMAWKDTVLVTPGEKVDVLVEMSNPGVWMSHCHIAEHLHSGMMMGFRVEESDGSAPGDAYRATAGSSMMEHMDAEMSMEEESHAHDGTEADDHHDEVMEEMMEEGLHAHDGNENDDHHNEVVVESDHAHDGTESDDHHVGESRAPLSWIALLIISLILMGILSYGVNKYINR
jgi:suppressor of ftsI